MHLAIFAHQAIEATLYDAYLTYPRAFYDRHATGQVLSRATNDLYPIRYFIGWGVVQGFQSAMMIIGVSIVLLGVNARLALYAGLTMPLIEVFAPQGVSYVGDGELARICKIAHNVMLGVVTQKGP